MSLQRREALVEQIVMAQPALHSFVRDLTTDLTAGSWDLVSYSYQKGFEALWDLAVNDQSGLLERPLLSLWRQSIELALKAAIVELIGSPLNQFGHNLKTLFQQLRDLLTEEVNDEDELTQRVSAMIADAQAIDPYADRFRYPASRRGQSYHGLAVDLDQLFQAHWIITTWCEGAVLEVRGDT